MYIQRRSTLKIIISPAKQMLEETDMLPASALPGYLDRTARILEYMKSLTYEEAKTLWACNDKIAQENYERFQKMHLTKEEEGYAGSLTHLPTLTPAILAYDGIAYKYMAPNVFEYGEFDYVQAHLRILSGFYGALKPLDGVAPYRLEMQAKAKVSGTKNLYEFWGDTLYKDVIDDSRIIINLASKEYSKCVEKYLQPEDTFVTCVFGELSKGKIVQKGVYAKMARGEMVRHLAMIHAESLDDLKSFHGLGYAYAPDYSNEKTYTFLRS